MKASIWFQKQLDKFKGDPLFEAEGRIFELEEQLAKAKKMEAGEEMKKGSKHYKTDGAEPFDLYKSGGIMWDFCIANIIKYAFRNRRELGQPVNPKDIEKMIHYAEELRTYIET